MKLDKNTVLYIVDKDTKIVSVCVSKEETSAADPNAFLKIWVSKYIEYPDNICTGQGRKFQSVKWNSIMQRVGIKAVSSGVESRNAQRAGERWNSFL